MGTIKLGRTTRRVGSRRFTSSGLVPTNLAATYAARVRAKSGARRMSEYRCPSRQMGHVFFRAIPLLKTYNSGAPCCEWLHLRGAHG
jgi:hypothetical protein